MSDRLALRAGQEHNTCSLKGRPYIKYSPIKVLLCFCLQIRLSLKDWEDAVDAQHIDAVYILRQLMFLKAFNFTAMPTLVSCPPYINTHLIFTSNPKYHLNVGILCGDSVVLSRFEQLSSPKRRYTLRERWKYGGIMFMKWDTYCHSSIILRTWHLLIMVMFMSIYSYNPEKGTY